MAAKKPALRTIEGFSVSSDIPLARSRGGKNAKWPFYAMEVGESFPVSLANIHLVRAAVYSYARVNGKKFTVRLTPGEAEAYRCWRIK